jgi:hypothetical protein
MSLRLFPLTAGLRSYLLVLVVLVSSLAWPPSW